MALISLLPLEMAKKLKPAIEAWNQEDPRISADRFIGELIKSRKRNITTPGRQPGL